MNSWIEFVKWLSEHLNGIEEFDDSYGKMVKLTLFLTKDEWQPICRDLEVKE